MYDISETDSKLNKNLIIKTLYEFKTKCKETLKLLRCKMQKYIKILIIKMYNARGMYFTVLCCYIGVTRSKKIVSDRDYQKNKERVQELEVLWKNETLDSTINKYIDAFDTTRLQAFTSQIVTFKILTQVPFFEWITIFYILSP